MASRASVALLAFALACASETPKSRSTPATTRASEVESALARLRAHETRVRRENDPETQPPSSRALGPNPYRLCPLADGAVGLLRGSSELVWLDASLAERARLPTPPVPSSCAVTKQGEILVGSELVSELSVYRIEPGGLVRGAPIPLPEQTRPRALAVRGDRVFIADSLAGTLLEIDHAGDERRRSTRRSPLCRGPIALETTAHHLITACLLDHALSVRPLDAAGAASEESVRVRHDGPFWGFDAIERDGALIIAAGGIENRPLERVRGEFGYVDSFVYVYRVQGDAAELLHAVNAADHGVLTPKAVVIEPRASGGFGVLAAGYGSDVLLRIELGKDLAASPAIAVEPFVPGAAAIVALGAGFAVSNPLLDAWISLGAAGRGHSLVPVQSALELPAPSVRLGEALFFTRLIAPWAESAGRKSRFTCETCHFEGGIDGRVHHSGRGDVRVSTKPLFGLLNNRPFFSRALDADLTSVSHHEFRVAGLGNTYDPWFSTSRRAAPWLSQLLPGTSDDSWNAESLRRALLDFLAVFHHEPNPWVRARTSFSGLERRGAELFRTRCESCHAARLRSDEPASAVAFDRWESLVLSESGPLVWARAEREKTGILPYVHEGGARVPSLRRLIRKWPYFTNGSARSIDDVLATVRFTRERFFHGSAPPETLALDAEERAALSAFLRLL